MVKTSKPNVCHLLLSGTLVLLMILNLIASYPLEEGSSCDLKQEELTGSGAGAGTCVVVKQCPPVIKSLKARRSHDFARCGFRGTLEIVCCPNDVILSEDDKDKLKATPKPTTTSTTMTTSKAEVRGPSIRKSVQVCEDLLERFKEQPISLHIAGGEDADPGEFSHMCALGYDNDGEPKIAYNCGGTLISERYVLTAAHCIISQSMGAPVRVRMGMTDLRTTDGEEVAIANITVHPEYQRKNKRNDLALIELERGVTFTNSLHPACLYTKPDNPKGLIVTGWGHLETAGRTSPVLQKGILSPVEVSDCNESYSRAPQISVTIQADQVCAISTSGKTDACQGDSGGPIQILSPASNVYFVVGVTSFGRGCGGTFPGVYARVYSYIDWIEKIVWPK